MDNIPSPLSEMLEELDSLDRVERAQYLLELSDDFQEVPETIATRPFRRTAASLSANLKRSSGLKTKTMAR